MRMTVLERIRWCIHHGGSGGSSAGVEGWLSRCRLEDGTVFFVRENRVRSSIDHFVSSSGVRQGMKAGHSLPGYDVLELACAPAAWSRCAAVVVSADARARAVERNRRFTVQWAEHEFREAPVRRAERLAAGAGA